MRRALAPAAMAAIALAGCGNSQTKPPRVDVPARPFGFVRVNLPKQGISFQRPYSWRYAPGKAPLLATITSADATIALWRYPRTEPLPTTPAELTAAKDALVGAAKARDKTFTVQKAKGTRAAHHPAVVIVADETVAGRPRTVRSTHIYAYGAEIVVDAFAPPKRFPRLEDQVFRRVVRSMRLTPPGG